MSVYDWQLIEAEMLARQAQGMFPHNFDLLCLDGLLAAKVGAKFSEIIIMN